MVTTSNGIGDLPDEITLLIATGGEPVDRRDSGSVGPSETTSTATDDTRATTDERFDSDDSKAVGDNGVGVPTENWTDDFDTVVEAIDTAVDDQVSTSGEWAVHRTTEQASVRRMLESEPIDCIVLVWPGTDHDEALELIRSLRSTHPLVPVVFVPSNAGDELARDAVTAGVSGYVPLSSDDGWTEILIEEVLRTIRQRYRRHRERTNARRFDALFEGTDGYTWILDREGTVLEVNDAVMAGTSELHTRSGELSSSRGGDESVDEMLINQPLWTFPSWECTDDSRADVREAVERVATGSTAHCEIELLDSALEAGVGEYTGDGVESGLDGETEPEIDENLDGAVEEAGDDDEITPSSTDGVSTNNGSRTLECTIRPVRDDTGAVDSLIARARDVTDRVRLERELRESEELHRVTLNHMTDTVLITDDDGRFTYVCPNVHFIFGYTAAEVHDLGTIDALLGEAPVNRERLETTGVITNVECTAMDKSGSEHALLVNARRVSIQDGTTLYSCRDVTKRKRREDAVTALHRTARELSYAEMPEEIAHVVVEDAADVLDLDASAVWLFDAADSVLRPVANTPTMERIHGPLEEHRPTDQRLVSKAFVERETQFFDDVNDSSVRSNPASDLRSAGFVALGDHGVFAVGSRERGQFDDVTREVAELLGATAKAALDRVERESTLRKQDRALKRQNKRLTRLNRINEIIREIDQALVAAESREEIEHAVCDRLTADDRFSFAWIGSVDTDERMVEPLAHDGDDPGYLDAISLSLPDESEGTGDRLTGGEPSGSNDDTGVGKTHDQGQEPAIQTAVTGAVTVVPNVVERQRTENWRRGALSREYQSIVSVPLVYDEFSYGVLTVYADRPSAFDDLSRAVLEELGETVASAIAAVERTEALLTDSVTRLTFDVRDEQFVFRVIAERTGCELTFNGRIHRRTDGPSIIATVDGASIEDVVRCAEELVTVDAVRVIADETDDSVERTNERGKADGGAGQRGTILLELAQPFVGVRLADHGIRLQSLASTPTESTLVVDVPRTVDVEQCTDIVENAFEMAELRSKRSVDRASMHDHRSALLENVTERQLEVVRLAYHCGFFESPRERTGEEIASILDISPAAFYRHNRTVQRKLYSIMFDNAGGVDRRL